MLFIGLFLAQTVFSQSKLEALLPEIEAVIEQAKKNIWVEIEPDQPLWNFPPWLGTMFLSEYYFELKGTIRTMQLSTSHQISLSTLSSMRPILHLSC
jgi:hypothetical protein